MLELNLPSYDYQLRKVEGQLQIFDPLRKKYLVLTPEEWVRQHFLNFLIQVKNVPVKLMKEEALLSYNQLQKRADILAYGRSGYPILLVECKASTEALEQDAIFQILTYNAGLEVPYIAITNGLMHFYGCKKNGTMEMIEELPDFETMDANY